MEGRHEAEALGKQFLRKSLGGRTFRKSCCPRKLASYMPKKPPVRLPFLMVGPIWFGRESVSGLGLGAGREPGLRVRRTPAAMLGVWTLRGEQVSEVGLKGPLTPLILLG